MKTPEKALIGFIGCSVTEGNMLPDKQQAYPHLLSQLLNQNGVQNDILLSTVPGSVTGPIESLLTNNPLKIAHLKSWRLKYPRMVVLERIEEEILSHAPDVVCILQGQPESFQTLIDLDKFTESLTTVVRLLLEQEIRVVLATLPWKSINFYRRKMSGIYSIWSDHSPERTIAYCDAIRKVAQEHGVPCVDVYAATENKEEWLFPDGVHPNLIGHEKISELFFPHVIALLKQPSE